MKQDIERGTPPSGGEDEHGPRTHTDLPPYDPKYQQSDVTDKADKVLLEAPRRHRTQTLFPYIFVRSVAGDQGRRPLWPPTVCWESCDIHLLPSGTGGFDFSKTILNPVAGQAYQVFVHVWNLGRLGAYGSRVRAWWVEPGFFNGTPDPRYTPHFIGGAYFDLGDRDSNESHQLIEIQAPWVVQMNQPAHECLLVAVDCATDPWDGSLDANNRRHVAQRNVTIIGGRDNLTPVVQQLAALAEDAQQLVVASAAVASAQLVGAAKRGLSSEKEVHGWNHSALAPDWKNRPIAAVRPDPNGGLRYLDLRETLELPDPQSPLPGGQHIDGPLEGVLAGLLQKSIGSKTFSGADVAQTITGKSDSAALLRFIHSDKTGSGGFSILTAPQS